jgi:hypothetical protein
LQKDHSNWLYLQQQLKTTTGSVDSPSTSHQKEQRVLMVSLHKKDAK